MRMKIDIFLWVDGCSLPIYGTYNDDVDAEGTMVAKYIQPIIDAASSDDFVQPIELGLFTVLKPWRIVAVEYSVEAVED